MFKEFREFALKGNVMDLAVGVIIGGAFGGIVNSLVNDIIMPPVGKLLGDLDFKDYFIQLGGDATLKTLDAVKKAGIPVVAYGNFLTVLINFLILAFIIFLMVKWMNSLKHEEAAAPPPAPPAPPRSEVLLAEIRDLLKR